MASCGRRASPRPVKATAEVLLGRKSPSATIGVAVLPVRAGIARADGHDEAQSIRRGDRTTGLEQALHQNAPAEWKGSFDFVLESYTLQVLPPDLRPDAIRQIASFVSPGGILLVIARGREPNDPPGNMPWPLTKDELAVFQSVGLKELRFEDYVDDETPPVRRFRATYRRE